MKMIKLFAVKVYMYLRGVKYEFANTVDQDQTAVSVFAYTT